MLMALFFVLFYILNYLLANRSLEFNQEFSVNGPISSV